VIPKKRSRCDEEEVIKMKLNDGNVSIQNHSQQTSGNRVRRLRIGCREDPGTGAILEGETEADVGKDESQQGENVAARLIIQRTGATDHGVASHPLLSV